MAETKRERDQRLVEARVAAQNAAVGLDRRPFESDGPYFERAMWHWKAEADNNLTEKERAYIVRVMRKIQRMNYDDAEPASIIAKLTGR